mmetsp:Transcript_176812/g.561421  ORF Transcript_176812/g.561421 Transcript_176812/m.561421 type:complete len:206 (+) Transcript_176812:1394-2011(+)
MEALLLAHLLLQQENDGPPPVDPWKFVKYVEQRIKQFDLVYEPLTQRMTPVIEVINLRTHILPLKSLIPFRRQGITPRIKGAWYRHPLAYIRGGRRRRNEQYVNSMDLERASLEAGLAALSGAASGAQPRANLEDIVPIPVAAVPAKGSGGGAANIPKPEDFVEVEGAANFPDPEDFVAEEDASIGFPQQTGRPRWCKTEFRHSI